MYVFVKPFYASNSCILQKISNSAPWGHTFRWVAEFGLTPEPEKKIWRKGRSLKRFKLLVTSSLVLHSRFLLIWFQLSSLIRC